MKTNLLKSICLSILFAGLVSCESNEPNVTENSGTVLIQTTVKNPDGASGSSYMQLISDFSKQTVGNANSIQVGYSAGIVVYGSDVFVTPEFGKDGTQELEKYSYTSERTLKKTGSLILPSMSGAYGLVKYNNEKAYIHMYNLGKMLIINPATMVKTGEIDLTSYAFGDNNPDPSYPIIRDGLLYVPLNQNSSSWMPYPEHKQSDVVIIDISTDKVVKLISETKSGLTFPVRPALREMIFKDENNDIYIACAGGFGLDPRFPETGLLCIPAGKTEFDDSKSWDLSQTPIEGTNYKPGSLSSCKYIGNGKLCAYITISELIGNNPYTSRYMLAVIIDMKNKTIKKIEGIPISDGFSALIETYNSQVVFCASGDKVSGFFSYDPVSGKVSDSPVITTSGNPTFIHFFQ